MDAGYEIAINGVIRDNKSDKAILFDSEDFGEIWVPRSVIIEQGDFEVVIERVWARRKGYTDE